MGCHRARLCCHSHHPRACSPLRPPVPPAAASAGGALVSYEAAGSDSDEPGAGALPPDVEIPAGPPPVLSRGSDDIFWMHQLHQSLMHKGVYSGEDDVEMWVSELRRVHDTWGACRKLNGCPLPPIQLITCNAVAYPCSSLATRPSQPC